MTYAPDNVQGPFLQGSDFFSLNEDDLRTRLTTMYSKIANSVNAKEIAIYDLSETLNGQQFYNPKNVQELRPDFRKVFTFDAILSGATLTFAHNIKGFTQFTRIYGTAYDGTYWKPVPYAAITIDYQIDIYVSSTDIIIKNGTAPTAPGITNGYVVLEYLKN
jgi:hypothetical protein